MFVCNLNCNRRIDFLHWLLNASLHIYAVAFIFFISYYVDVLVLCSMYQAFACCLSCTCTGGTCHLSEQSPLPCLSYCLVAAKTHRTGDGSFDRDLFLFEE